VYAWTSSNSWWEEFDVNQSERLVRSRPMRGADYEDYMGNHRNMFLLCDMLGQVWEWTSTPWSANSLDALNDSFTSPFRCIRGGCFMGTNRLARCSERDFTDSSVARRCDGFRVARQ
jgi:formylglycine-generating enzyme required for sulfatase activity